MLIWKDTKTPGGRRQQDRRQKKKELLCRDEMMNTVDGHVAILIILYMRIS